MIAPITPFPFAPASAGPAYRGGPPLSSQSTIERILSEEGVVIDHAGDATDAVRRFASDEHDLVILTHDETSQTLAAAASQGARAIQSLRTRAAQEGRRFVPVLMLTNASEHDAFSEARELGADDVLPIGLPPQQAAARVRAYLALSARGNQRTGPPRQGQSPWRHELTQRLVHDLRNPLAGLSSNLAYMDDRLSDSGDPEVREALADCRAAVGRLRRAATMLVDLGRLEEGNLQPRCSETLVAALLQDLLAQRLHEATLRDLQLVAEVPPGLTGLIDHEMVARMLHALLDHALRYAQTGTVVQLQAAPGAPGSVEGAAPRAGGLTLRVMAEGEWLPKVERTYLSRGAGGVSGALGARGAAGARGAQPLPSVAEIGLGLHYVQLAALAHSGGLEVQDDPPAAPRRTTVVLSL